jgi:hypothetical protein
MAAELNAWRKGLIGETGTAWLRAAVLDAHRRRVPFGAIHAATGITEAEYAYFATTPDTFLTSETEAERPTPLSTAPVRELSAQMAKLVRRELTAWRGGGTPEWLIETIGTAHRNGIPRQAIQAATEMTDSEYFELLDRAGIDPTAVGNG